MPSLPPPQQLLVWAVLLPAAVAGTNQLLFNLIPIHDGLRLLLYPWMAFTTAVLSWCAGRYLSPAWLRWIVFAWCLVLLDLLTIAACMSGPLSDDFAFILVSAQISLVVLWSILADVHWQWRLPSIAAAAALVILFAGNFTSRWSVLSWGILMVFTAVVAALVCGGLRWIGFVLQHKSGTSCDAPQLVSMKAHQFGVKHMLIWAAAIAPLLLVARGMDVLILTNLDVPNAFHAALLAVSMATVNLIAIWTVLGSGLWFARVATLLVVPLAFSIGLEGYTSFLRPPIGTRWPRSPLLYLMSNMDGLWAVWLWSNALLLAALLLFLRAGSYRLVRKAC